MDGGVEIMMIEGGAERKRMERGKEECFATRDHTALSKDFKL